MIVHPPFFRGKVRIVCAQRETLSLRAVDASHVPRVCAVFPRTPGGFLAASHETSVGQQIVAHQASSRDGQTEAATFRKTFPQKKKKTLVQIRVAP